MTIKPPTVGSLFRKRLDEKAFRKYVDDLTTKEGELGLCGNYMKQLLDQVDKLRRWYMVYWAGDLAIGVFLGWLIFGCEMN